MDRRPVVGRENELTFADAFLERAGRRSGVLVFEGEAGIGKTTVWREAVRRADQAGFRTLSCRPGEMETKLALSAVADLLDPVPEETFASLPDPQRKALEVVLLRAAPGRAGMEGRQVATAFRSLLDVLSAERSLLVAVDDVQWVDAASAAVIAFALRRLAGRPIAWLFTRRSGEPAAFGAERLVAPESLARRQLGPLTLAALHHVLKDRLEQPLSRPVLARVHRVSGGNPLYALEIARELLRAGDAPSLGSIPVPDDLRELIAGRVRRLPPGTRDALLACAALSQPTTALVDERALSPGEEADIVSVDSDGRIAFLHPLYASAVYGSASQSRRRALHARLAELVDDVEERARHLALASAEPDERVARALEEGARVARIRGAWESAAELLEQGARLTPAERRNEVHRRTIHAAEHHVHAGDRARARALIEEVLDDSPTRSMRADALRLLGEISYNDGSFEEAKRPFAESIDYADDARLAVVSELGLGYVYSNLWDFPTARLHSERALQRSEAIGEGSLIAEALALHAMMDFLCARGIDWEKVERSLALEDREALATLQRRPSTIAALLLLYAGRHGEARERMRAICATARERGDESDLAFILLWLSWLETRSGDFPAALGLAEEAASLATLTGSPTVEAWVLTQRAYVHAHRGQVAQTRRDCADAAPLIQRFDFALPTIWVAASLILLELSLGDPRAAWEACEPLVRAVEAQGVGEPVPLFFLPDALEALVALGDLERAEGLLEALEERGRELDRVWALATAARCRGLLLAARGDVAGGAHALEEALAHHERIELPFERARALLVKGGVERRARKRTRAKATLEEALAEFERLGAPLFAKRAREELSRVGLRRSNGDELTPSERRVAQLAATGLTNREIASELFISPKTVEANLSRVYRKLGISSRAQLGARFAERVQT
jgi:DNA-binding CsgD family transcriptional regulator/TolA-binding protein